MSHLIPYLLGALTPLTWLGLSRVLARKVPLNLINGMVFPNANDPGWNSVGDGWRLGPVRVSNFKTLEVDNIEVHVSRKVIKKYQNAIRNEHMRYCLELPELKTHLKKFS